MERKFTKKKIILALLSAAAVVIILLGINDVRPAPLGRLALQGPTDVTCYDDGMVISDDAGSRLIFADSEGKVYRVTGLDRDGAPFDFVNEIDAGNGRLFVFGAKVDLNGFYYLSEAVAEYSTAGDYIRTVYSESYGEDDYITDAHFLDLRVCADGRIVLAVSRKGSIDLLDITDGEGKLVKSIPENMEPNGALIYDDDLSCYIWEGKAWFLKASADGSLTEIDPHTFAEEIKEYFSIGDIGYDEVELNRYLIPLAYLSTKRSPDGAPESFFYTNISGLNRFDFDTRENEVITSVKLAFPVFAFNLLFYLSILYLAVMCLAWIVRSLRNGNNAGRIRTILVALGLSAVVSCFYTVGSYRLLSDEYDRRTAALSRQLDVILESNFADVIDGAYKEGVREYCIDSANAERFAEFRKEILAFNNANGKYDCFYTGVLIANGTDLNTLIYTDEPGNTANFEYTVESALEFRETVSDRGLSDIEDNGTLFVTSIHFIDDEEGNFKALTSVGFKKDNLISKQRDLGLRMLLSLSVICIMLYVCSKSLSQLGRDVSIYKEQKKLNPLTSRIPLLCGIAAFLSTVICQFDSVILVYASKSLCNGMSALEADRIAALPVALYSFGIMIGSALLVFVSRFLKDRANALVFCLAGAGSMALAVLAMKAGNIYIFIAAKCLEGIAIGGAAYSLIFASPYNCKDAQERSRLISTSQTAAVAAAILGNFAGGYISEYLSYTTVFAVKGVLCVGLAVICLFMYSKETGLNIKEEEKAGKAWGFFVRKKALSFYLLFILPVTLLNGYRSYLFPIYSGNAGISASMLSNIYVLSRAGAFLASDAINSAVEKVRPYRLMMLSGMVCSLCFVLFLVSPNIFWAVAVLIISNILLRAGNTGSIYYQAELCGELGYEAKKVSIGSETVKGVFGSLSSPALSFFLALGNNWACAAVGFVSCALMSLFSLFTKRGKTA